ncbi:MAG: glycosyltransferase family 39 protein [Bacteroidaceae bacterium]|nr:glycosyltransferase family 39 protein [Bacteroidaceae bacterium]
MMNGMTPYVDFSDSKGLLLWLIYGAGYLLSPTNYYGVFWISVLLWILIFYYCYKILTLYFDEEKAVKGAFLMAIPFFIYLFYYETRAECFCTLPVIHGIYTTQLFIKDKEDSKFLKNIFLLGVGTVSCFMMKWSISLMMLSFIFSVLLFCRQWDRRAKIFGFYICGAILFMLPFIFYFVYVGNLVDFLVEYIFVTGKTVSAGNSTFVADYVSKCVELFTTRRGIYLIYIAATVYLFVKNKDKKYAVNIISSVAFVFMSIIHDLGYYLYIASSFGIFLLVVIMTVANKIFMQKLVFVSSVCLSFFVCLGGHIRRLQLMGYKNWRLVYNDENVKMSYENADRVMSEVKNPKVLCLNCGEKGIGMGNNTLPACKYWAYQVGMTDEMQKNAIDCVKERKADYVICFADSESDKNFLHENGYEFVAKLIDCTNVRNIYKRRIVE